MEVTRDQFVRAWPRGRLDRLPHLLAGAAEAGVTTPARWAMWLAQLGHESDQGRLLVEVWGPTAAQLAYEPPGRVAARLGNTEKGDGWRYRGRGAIQLTGRANYRSAGEALGLALEAHPELVELPEVAFRAAAWFWRVNRINDLADAGDLEAVTRRINGGLNGLEARRQLLEQARRALAGAAV